MEFKDLFKPYSPKTHGDLMTYLRKHDGLRADNLFCEPEYFFTIRDLGLIVPLFSGVRIDRSPIPDLGYTVNKDFLLEGSNSEEYNMSLVSAKSGVYEPRKVLKGVNWSIFNLDYRKLLESHK